MFSISSGRIAVGVAFIVCALIAGATASSANGTKWEGDNDNSNLSCSDQYRCSDWRGGVYRRNADGVTYYYGGSEELGYGNKPKRIYYHEFVHTDVIEQPDYYQDY